MEIEKKYYEADSSEAELALLRSRVHHLQDDIYIWREIPKPSVFQVGVCGSRLRELTDGLEKFYLIIDLTEPERPSAKVRNAIKDIFTSMPNLASGAVFVGNNALLRVALKFVLSRANLQGWAVGKNLDDCLSLISKHKNSE